MPFMVNIHISKVGSNNFQRFPVIEFAFDFVPDFIVIYSIHMLLSFCVLYFEIKFSSFIILESFSFPIDTPFSAVPYSFLCP